MMTVRKDFKFSELLLDDDVTTCFHLVLNMIIDVVMLDKMTLKKKY